MFPKPRVAGSIPAEGTPTRTFCHAECRNRPDSAAKAQTPLAYRVSVKRPWIRFSDANGLTPWTSGGTDYHLIFRPLLPDEHTC